MIGWHIARTLEDYLASAKISNRDTEEYKSVRCNGKCSQVCQYIEKTCEFEDADGNKCNIPKGIINCNSDFNFYL